MALVKLAKSVVNAKLMVEGLPEEDQTRLKTLVQNALSYTVAGAEHMPSVGPGKWDGRTSFFEWVTCKFPAGFTHTVRKTLEKAGHHVQIVSATLPPPLGLREPKINDFPPDPRYDYQARTVEKLLRHGQMIAQVATGGGKSGIAALATAVIKRSTLFLTTRQVLMYQMKRNFTESLRCRYVAGEKDLAGQRIGVVGDGLWRPGRETDLINVGMVQTIAARLNSGDPKTVAETLEFLKRQEFVILEEAHEASSDSFYEILRHCTSAIYRLALTATPFMRDDEEANMRLMACTGPIAIMVTEKELIDKGILATPYFVTFQVPYVPDTGALASDKAGKSVLGARLGWSTDYMRARTLGIVHNKARNDRIVEECVKAKSFGLSTMVLVQQTKHGNLLEWAMKDAGLAAEYIYGESSQEDREMALLKLASGKIDVLIGTTILDVGVDVPALGVVILAGGGKAEVALRQRIGRGLRAKKTGPNIAIIVDFQDKSNKHLYSHYLSRRGVIEATPGFAERQFNVGSPFNYQAFFGTPKAA